MAGAGGADGGGSRIAGSARCRSGRGRNRPPSGPGPGAEARRVGQDGLPGKGTGTTEAPRPGRTLAQESRPMRKVLLAGVLAAAALAALPDRSHGWGRDPYNRHGYRWLEQL